MQRGHNPHLCFRLSPDYTPPKWSAVRRNSVIAFENPPGPRWCRALPWTLLYYRLPSLLREQAAAIHFWCCQSMPAS